MRAAISLSRLIRASGAALALGLLPAPLLAQTTSPSDDAAGFRLQPSAPPRAQGPVDEKAPPPAPATPAATPSATATPAPAITPSAAPQRTPEAAPATQPRATRSPAPRSGAVPAPIPAPPVAAPSATAPSTTALPTSAPLPTAAPPEAGASGVASPAPPAPTGQTTPGTASLSSGWIALAAAVLLAAVLGAWLWWRTRTAPRALPAPDANRYRAPAEPLPAEPADDAPSPQPESALAEPGPALLLALEATRMSATLVNATLAYRLSVTNAGPAPLRDVAIAGDMTSAHASRPAEELLGATAAGLAPIHGIAALAPGESVTLGGELRLPLAAILPIRRGDAHLFVPLARFAVTGRDPSGSAVESRRAFLVGQPGRVEAGGRLQPFRLDLGPRVYSEVGQRALA